MLHDAALPVNALTVASSRVTFPSPHLPQVALLDKEHFPRDKICGDAVCTPAIHILNVSNSWPVGIAAAGLWGLLCRPGCQAAAGGLGASLLLTCCWAWA